jgi:PIN domain nuclease of toxin-antitoxin system
LRALLDTCTPLWWMCESGRLSRPARALFEDPSSILYWSAASTWELAIKTRRGGVILPSLIEEFLPQAFEEDGIRSIPIEDRHALAAARLPDHHRDPFDRMLVAQALIEGLPLVTGDRGLKSYDVEIVW